MTCSATFSGSRYFTALDTTPWEPGLLSGTCKTSVLSGCAAEQPSGPRINHCPTTVGCGDESLAHWRKTGQDEASVVGEDLQC